MKFARIAFATAAIPIILYSAASAQVSGCDICHAKSDFKRVLKSGRIQSLYVDQAMIDASVHTGKQCIDCHVDIAEIPHTTKPQPVNCGQCHYEGNTVGAPQRNIKQEYDESVHAQALLGGNTEAPTCQECHGSHQILSHEDPASRTAKMNIPRTCGKCHLEVFAQYQTSIHGVVLGKGNEDTPTCADCHSEHGVRSHEDPQSPIYATNVAQTCSHCHAAEGIVGKYGISSGQVDTYDDSFHGVAMRFGMRTVANCASCHGIHDIRADDDPASSVHVDNTPETCGKCHPGANANYAIGKIHIEAQNPDAGIVYFVASFFKWLTISTVCALILHIVLDLSRQIRNRRRDANH